MNPSTQDILSSFENLPTDKIIILPNNKNIVMAANQAKSVTVKQVEVVPSRTIPQGLAAMLSLQPDGELKDVAGKMMKAYEHVRTGEITVATRSVEIDGVKVETGQVIALLDGKLVASAGSVEEGVLQFLEKVDAPEHELVTLFYGENMTHAEANRIADVIGKTYGNLEVEIQEDEWLLVDAISPFAGGARGLTRAHIFDRERRLVASVAQEGLVRPIQKKT